MANNRRHHMTLTAADRCDRCGARAYVLVCVLVADGGDHELLFCAHHYQQHERRLVITGARAVLDQRHQLQSQETLSGRVDAARGLPRIADEGRDA